MILSLTFFYIEINAFVPSTLSSSASLSLSTRRKPKPKILTRSCCFIIPVHNRITATTSTIRTTTILYGVTGSEDATNKSSNNSDDDDDSTSTSIVSEVGSAFVGGDDDDPPPGGGGGGATPIVDSGGSSTPIAVPPLPPPPVPPEPPEPEPSLVAGSEGGRAPPRAGEWFDWLGHRFTKVKAQKRWIGWQLVCRRHTPRGCSSALKCNRARRFRGVANFALDSPEFQAESDLTIHILMHWAMAELAEETKVCLMAEPYMQSTDDCLSLCELDEMAIAQQLEAEAAPVVVPLAVAAVAASDSEGSEAAVASPVASVGSTGSSSSSSSSSSGSD